MKFTPSEMGLLEHRFTVPDCLADALNDGADYPELSWEQIQDKAVALWDRLQKQNGEVDLATLSPVEKDILQDVVNGSTVFGGIDDAVATGEISKGKFMSMFKAAKSIEEKFLAEGMKVAFPQH